MGKTGYKGFKKGLIGRDKQYAENTVFEEPEAEVCSKGMHYCKNPFDVLDHYDLVNGDGSFNDFAVVEPLAEEKTDDDKKFCTTKLKIGAKFSFSGFVKACVDFVIEKTKYELEVNQEDDARIGSSGDYAQIGSSSDYAQIGSSGDYARIGSSGYGARIGSSGDSAQIDSTGEYSVIMCAGHNCRAKAKMGSFITLAEWVYSEEKDCWIPIHVKTEQVDGERIKPDTYYRLENGEFVEAE